ncbi:MAG: hypothetical protein M3X11_20985, partial [Acidobacteriota bacterium]|nr:hypothetical protein [Acidobacteriota bacterium]
SKLKIQEMGSRYLFIVLYCFIERWLSRGDYHSARRAAIKIAATNEAAATPLDSDEAVLEPGSLSR